MTNEVSSELRKAAILIQCLDRDSANLLLTQLNRQTATEVTRIANQLEQVSGREKQQVLAEFLETVQIVSQSESPLKFAEVRMPELLSHQTQRGEVELRHNGIRQTKFAKGETAQAEMAQSEKTQGEKTQSEINKSQGLSEI